MSDLPKVAKVTLKATKVVTEDYKVIIHFDAGTTNQEVQDFLNTTTDFSLHFGLDVIGNNLNYPSPNINVTMLANPSPVCSDGVCTAVLNHMKNEDGTNVQLPPPAANLDIENQSTVQIWWGYGDFKVQEDLNNGNIDFEYIPPTQD